MNGEAPTIRPLGQEDAEAWRTIRLEALANAPEAFGDSYEAAASRPIEQFRQTVIGPFPPFGAFSGEALVGTVGFYVMGGPKMSHRGQLWGMYVAPAVRGRGVGRALIEAVIAHAKPRVEQIHLHVVTTNEGAYRLYRRMGFQPYGIEPRALRHDGRYYDETMMVLDLAVARAP